MSPTTDVRHPAAVQSRWATNVKVPVFPSRETSPGTMDSAVIRQLNRYVPSSPIAVAGRSGPVVVGADTASNVEVDVGADVGVATLLLDLLRVVVPVPDAADPADRLVGGGAGGAAPIPVAVGDGAADVNDGVEIVADSTGLDPTTLAATDRSAVEPDREIRKTVAATATTAPTAPAIAHERETRRSGRARVVDDLGEGRSDCCGRGRCSDLSR